MRLTSICGLGQVALGPVMSVLRLPAHPGSQLSAAMAATGREFFTVRTVAEALGEFRPAHRTAGETVPLRAAAGPGARRGDPRPHALPGL